MAFTIWTNGKFSDEATRLLEEGTRRHRLVTSAVATASVLVAGEPDPSLLEADIAFGQPAPEDCLRNERLKRELRLRLLYPTVAEGIPA